MHHLFNETSGIRPSGAKTPTSTGKATLLDYIVSIWNGNKLPFAVFRCSAFSDLPLTNWDFECISILQNGAIFVFLYQYLGGTSIFFRGTTAEGWTGGWKTLASTSDIPTSEWITLPYMSSYYCMATVTAPDGKRPVVTLAGSSIAADLIIQVRVAFAGGNNWQIIALSDQKFASGDTVNVTLIYA